MTERTFTVTYTSEQRLTVLYALGFMRAMLGNMGTGMFDVSDVRDSVTNLIGDMTKAPGVDSGTDAARAILQPAAPPAPTAHSPRDYFAADRKGNAPSVAPDGAELQPATIVSAQEKKSAKGAYLAVIYNVAGKGGKANCFDPALWPHITARQGKSAELWIAESGNYLNIVGVRG